MLGPPSKAGKGVDRPFPFLFFLEKKGGVMEILHGFCLVFGY
jgi:hypothetical protein